MAREDDYRSKTVVLDGWKFFITHPNPELAWELGVELTKLIGEPVAGMAGAGGDEEKSAAALPLAVGALMARVDPKQSLLLVKRLLKSVEVHGNEEEGNDKKFLIDDAGFKVFFHGRMGLLWKVIGETVAFTHGDFFEAMKTGIQEMIVKAMKDAAE